MKTNEELAREAELSKEVFLTNQCRARIDRFASLVEQRLIAKLLEGVGEPALPKGIGISASFKLDYYTADQLAAAVLAYKQDADLYRELLMGVSKKFPGESRHETAKRYIYNWEGRDVDSKAAAIRGANT